MSDIVIELQDPTLELNGAAPVVEFYASALVSVGGGTEVAEERLLPTPLGDPGQVPAVNAEGDGVEWADASAGSTGEPPALRAAYREASATGTVTTDDGIVVSAAAVTQHLPAVADMLDTGETYREVQFQASGGAITVDVPSADALYGLDGALLSSVTIPTGQSALFGTFTSGSPDAWVLMSHSGRMADLYTVGLAVACADYTTFVNDYAGFVATTLVGGAVGQPIFVLYDDMSLDRFVTTGTGCASRMTLTTSDHAGKTLSANVLLALPAFTGTLRWVRTIATEDGGTTYTVGAPDVGATIDLDVIPAHAMQIQFTAPLSAGLIGALDPDGDGDRAELLATEFQDHTVQLLEVFFGTGDPTDSRNGPWHLPEGTALEVGAILRRPTAIGSVPIENVKADDLVKVANARETRGLGVIRMGPPYTLQAMDVMMLRASGFPDNVESADGSIVPTATQGDVGLGHLDLVVDPANVTAGGFVQGPLDSLELNDPAAQAYLVGKLLAGHAIDITVDEDDKIVIAVDLTEATYDDLPGLTTALTRVSSKFTAAGSGVALSTAAATVGTLNLGALGSGDFVEFEFFATVFNNSALTRSITPAIRLGSTTVASLSAGSVTTGNTITFRVRGVMRCTGAATQVMGIEGQSANVTLIQASGTASVDTSAGATLDLRFTSSADNATQTGTLVSAHAQVFRA